MAAICVAVAGEEEAHHPSVAGPATLRARQFATVCQHSGGSKHNVPKEESWWERWRGVKEAAHAGEHAFAEQLHMQLWTEIGPLHPIKILLRHEAFEDAAELVPLLFRHGAAPQVDARPERGARHWRRARVGCSR